MPSDAIREARQRQDHSVELAAKGWYHSFDLPGVGAIDGVIPVARLEERYAHFPIPADLHGKRVLDIGAWDGWFTFAAERRGAQVTAIDCVEAPHLLELHRRLSSKADYRIREIYELPAAGLGTFDIVFLLGVLYHLRHPLLALEIVCALATDIVIVESFVTDGDTWRENNGEIPSMEFYEGYELANQFDNWVGPSVACLLAMCRAAGFARVELLRAEPYNAMVACYRKWEPPPFQPAAPAPELISAADSANYGINLSSHKEQYLACWFRSPRETIAKEDLRLEVGEFGAASVWAGRRDDLWTANFYVPRGLPPGWHEVRLRFADSGFSNSVRIAVDLPLDAGQIVCLDARDPTDWNGPGIHLATGGYLTAWVAGLPENADRHNVRPSLGEARLNVAWLGAPDSAGVRQVNTVVPSDLSKGQHELRIECGPSVSAPLEVTLV